jgi:hypothetical protein
LKNLRYRLIKPDWAKALLPNGEKNPKFTENFEGPSILEGEFEERELKALNELGYNVYYFPNGASQVSGKFLSGKEIDQYNVVFVDMDLKDEIYTSKEEFLTKVSEFEIDPNKIVFSGNGVHIYWNVEDLDRETYILIQFMLINHFKTDHSVWTPLQLMRVGGTLNTKRHGDYVRSEILLEDLKTSHKVEDFMNLLEMPSSDQIKKFEKHCAKLDGTYEMPELNEVDFDTLPVKFLELIEEDENIKNLFQNPKETCGDRSIADYKLANILFDKDFDLEETLQVIANGAKAKSRADGRDYAYNTVEKVFELRNSDETYSDYELASDLVRSDSFGKGVGTPVQGNPIWDCLELKWCTTQVLGIIAGPGVGKTETTLFQFKHMAEKDPDSLHVFFTLEMPERQVAKRWLDVIQDKKELSNRVIFIGNEDKKGMPRNIGTQDIYGYVKNIEKRYGKKVKTVVIDHINILSRNVNKKKKPFIKADMEYKSNKGDESALTKEGLLFVCKHLAKNLDVFLIIQSQTTKDKAGNGDVALGLSAAFGNSAFEWNTDFIITIWQPLRLVQDDTDLKILAWH